MMMICILVVKSSLTSSYPRLDFSYHLLLLKSPPLVFLNSLPLDLRCLMTLGLRLAF